VRRPGLQRNTPVGQTRERRHDRAKYHDQAMHGAHLDEELWIDELQAGLEQLKPHHQRKNPANEAHGQREDQVKTPDLLVVGRQKPAQQPLGRGRMSVPMSRFRNGRGLLQCWLRRYLWGHRNTPLILFTQMSGAAVGLPAVTAALQQSPLAAPHHRTRSPSHYGYTEAPPPGPPASACSETPQ